MLQLAAKNFICVSQVDGRSPSIWTILHCFSKAISMELVHRWPAKVRKLWDAGISDGGFTHCTTLLHPRSISVCSCMYMLTIRNWLVIEEAEQPLSWISTRLRKAGGEVGKPESRSVRGVDSSLGLKAWEERLSSLGRLCSPALLTWQELILLPGNFCVRQAFSALDDAYLQWGGSPALLGPPTQLLILQKYCLISSLAIPYPKEVNANQSQQQSIQQKIFIIIWFLYLWGV